ncbi:FMN-binding domain protein [Natronomonas pharaonis DSM 2160]|uniref:FMN-binding domain protein n=1 Tax=Natronomonas pharaonis (strain ATCC 35678 / DSM 2160 / CIP 103997 / JCM 8858 / NBRC 14720 / NCIMB 2260 / Gabara) TaxID=348780 RepID=A0A1U7EU05_NATPD|nr:pyridoxamine 5'-phosphate oxidase family protein [Natronomonas pharaonis]CAI48411.1 FMN-binding domain protein [Natronomonas pharaonis DSM 2160]
MDVVENTLGASIDAFLSRPLFGHLATHHPDGPRESPVWYLWEDDTAWVLGDSATDTFPARIEQEPACALGVVDFDAERGLVQHVGIRGRGSVEAFNRDRAERLLARYLGADRSGWDRRFADYIADPTETALLVRVEPETVVARDQSYAPAPVG